MKPLPTRKANTILKALTNELGIIRSISVYLNAGGCGIVAEELYKMLNDLGLSPKLVVVTGNAEETVNNLRNKDTPSKTEFAHIMVSTNKQLIDSNGPVKHLEETRYSNYEAVEGLSIDLLKDWNSDKYARAWNGCFDRSNIPEIRKRFKKIKRELAKKYLAVSK